MGVTVTEECLQMWEQLKQRELKFCNFKLDIDTNLVPNFIFEGLPDEPNPFELWKGSFATDDCLFSISEVESNNYNCEI